MGAGAVGPGDRIRILVVDDDEQARRLLREAFSEVDDTVELEMVPDGLGALEHLGLRDGECQQVPALVVLDLDLPDVHGCTVLEEVRGHPGTENLPVVIFSQNDGQSIVDECYEAGANAYVVKPPDYDGLVEFVQQLVSFWSPTPTGTG